MLVAPATANTIAKWALGISDNLALGLITEAVGLRLPVAAGALSDAQAAHPAFAGHVATLRAAGVTVLLGGANQDAALDDLDREPARQSLGRAGTPQDRRRPAAAEGWIKSFAERHGGS